jgi:anti-anti-sigma factor
MFSSEQWGDVTEVSFPHGRMQDPDETHVFGHLLALVKKIGTGKLRLNFAGVHHVSSAELGFLVVLRKQIQASGGQLTLCNIEPTVYKFFELTGFNRIFKIERGREGDEEGGVPSKLQPKKPIGGAGVSLPIPTSE